LGETAALLKGCEHTDRHPPLLPSEALVDLVGVGFELAI